MGRAQANASYVTTCSHVCLNVLHPPPDSGLQRNCVVPTSGSNFPALDLGSPQRSTSLSRLSSGCLHTRFEITSTLEDDQPMMIFVQMALRRHPDHVVRSLYGTPMSLANIHLRPSYISPKLQLVCTIDMPCAFVSAFERSTPVIRGSQSGSSSEIHALVAQVRAFALTSQVTPTLAASSPGLIKSISHSGHKRSIPPELCSAVRSNELGGWKQHLYRFCAQEELCRRPDLPLACCKLSLPTVGHPHTFWSRTPTG